MDAQKEVTLLLDPDGSVLIANKTACLKLNRELEELRHLKVSDLIEPRLWERYRRIGEGVISSGKGEVFEDVIEGSEYEFNIHPVFNRAGVVDRLAVTIYDITELRGALQSAAEGEMRLSLALDGIGDGIWDMDMVSNHVVYSKRLEEMLGYPPGEIGSDQARWQALVHPDDLEEARKDYQRFVAEGCRLYSSEHRLRCRDGSYRWILDRGVVIDRLPDGTPKRMVGTHMDITRRKEMEEALRREEDKFHSLVEQSTDGVVLIDEGGKLALVNGAFENIIGMERGALIGRSIFDMQAHMTVLSPEKGAREKMMSSVHAFLEGKMEAATVHQTYEVEYLNPDGRKKSLTLKPFPLRTGMGMMIGVVVIDNTDRQLAENALHLANTKLNLLNSITRHDILNQVMILKMNIERERLQAHDQNSRQRLEKIAMAVENIRRQVSFTSEYQDMGVHAPEWQRLANVVARAAGTLNLEGVSVHNVAQDLEVFADPMLEKVFYTLLENSIRHGDHVRSVTISDRIEGEDLLIMYEDDGVGIPEEHKELIFSRGFGSNSGLGLFFSREILDLTHITIAEKGEYGKGVLFEMRVPYDAFRLAAKNR
jgi:PAS domain S-box-containing protein